MIDRMGCVIAARCLFCLHHRIRLQPAVCYYPRATASSYPESRATWYVSARLSETLIATLIHSDDLYADARGNAVFVLRGEDHQPVGAELRGTGPVRWHGLAPDSGRDLGYFRVTPASPDGITSEASKFGFLGLAFFIGSIVQPAPSWLAIGAESIQSGQGQEIALWSHDARVSAAGTYQTKKCCSERKKLSLPASKRMGQFM
jgi:hypothetical protein